MCLMRSGNHTVPLHRFPTAAAPRPNESPAGRRATYERRAPTGKGKRSEDVLEDPEYHREVGQFYSGWLCDSHKPLNTQSPICSKVILKAKKQAVK